MEKPTPPSDLWEQLDIARSNCGRIRPASSRSVKSEPKKERGKPIFYYTLALRTEMTRRIKEGIEERRAKGLRLGRPPLPLEDVKAVIALRQAGLSFREITRRLNGCVGNPHLVWKRWHEGYYTRIYGEA
jgi:hypothetical protein